MPRKSLETISPPQVDRDTAIGLLTSQFEAAQRLRKSRPLGDDDLERWGLATKTQLEKAFGRGSPHVWAVVDAGVRSVCPVGADAKWWEAYRVERLASQMRELAIAINRLGAEPKIPVPPAPKVEKAPRPRRVDPEPAPDLRPARTPFAPPLPSHKVAAARGADLLAVATADDVAAEDVFSAWTDAPPPPRSEARVAPIDHFTGVACLNGHMITGAAEAYPNRATPRCRECGAATLRACRDCGVAVRGGPYAARLDDRAEPAWSVPNYCHSCGGSFPWTRFRREAVEATITELHELEPDDREGLLALVEDIVNVTPKTAVAVIRWQRALSKLSPPTRALVSEVLRQATVPFVCQHLGLVG